MAARIAASLATRDPKQAGRARVRGHLPVKKSKRFKAAGEVRREHCTART